MRQYDYEITYTPYIDTVYHGYLAKLKPGDVCRVWMDGGIRKGDIIHQRIASRVRDVRRAKGWGVSVTCVNGSVLVRRYANDPNFVKPAKKPRGRPDRYPALKSIRPRCWLRFPLTEVPHAGSLEANRLRAAVARFNKANPAKRLTSRWFNTGFAVYREY